jgi:hypothetical protein
VLVPPEGTKLGCLKEFLTYLQVRPDLYQRPIGNILLGSHGWSSGELLMPMYPGQDGKTTYEVLQGIIDAGTDATRILIPNELLEQTPGQPLEHTVHIRACNIGNAAPVIDKMQEALGCEVNVSAPKHFYEIWKEPGIGWFEYLCYGFILRAKTAYTSRDSLVRAFCNANYTFLDSARTLVPESSYRAWIPKTHLDVPSAVSDPRQSQDIPDPDDGTNQIAPTIPCKREYRVDVAAPWRVPFFRTNRNMLPDDAKPSLCLEFMKTTLKADPKSPYNTTHPWPAYRRCGYANFGEFIDGHSWNFQCKQTTAKDPGTGLMVPCWALICTGTRVTYTIIVPITTNPTATDKTTDRLMVNYYPEDRGFPVLNLCEDNSDFFYMTSE